MPQAHRIAVNPSNKNQRLIMWNNGRLEPAGKSPPPAIPSSPLDSLQAGTAPISSVDGVIRALQVTSWSPTMSGYVFTRYGQVFEFGDATPTALNTQLVSFSYPYDGYVDAVFNPAADGQGYGLDSEGGVWPFGGAPAIENLDIEGDGMAHRLYMPDWSTKKYIIWDLLGRRHIRQGAVQITAFIQQPTGVQSFLQVERLYNGYLGSACAFYDNFDAGGGDGWGLASWGYIHSLNDAQLVFGNPQHPDWAYSSDLFIIDDGLGPTPLRLGVLSVYGNVEEFFVSTAPTVTISSTSPADPTTTTTHPTVQVTYKDLQGDGANKWEIGVFTAAQYGIGGFDPATSPATWRKEIGLPQARNVASFKIESTLANATYRVYVRATDSSNLASAWVNRQWVQNVTPPTAPVLIAQSPDPLTGVPLTARVGVLASGGLFYVEYQDAITDPWRYVRNAGGAVPITTPLSLSWNFDTPGNIEDWQPTPGSYSLAQSTDRSFSGAGSLKVTVTAAQPTIFPFSAYGAGFGVPVAPATPGVTHNLVAHVWTALAGRSAQVIAVWINAAGVEVGSRSGSGFSPLTQNAWTTFNYTTAISAPPDAAFFCLQVQYIVTGGGNVPNAEVFYIDEVSESSTAKQVSINDLEATYGVPRTYRARQVVGDLDLASSYSATLASTVPATSWTLIDIYTTDGSIISARDFEWDRKVVAGIFQPDGRAEPVVITGAKAVKAPTLKLQLRTLSKAAFDLLEKMIISDSVLLLRDPFQRKMYVKVTDTINFKQLRAVPLNTETTKIRHAHEIDVPVTTVSRPLTGPATGSLALTE